MSYEKMHELVDSNFDALVDGIKKFVGMDSVADESIIDMSAADPFGPKMTKVLNEFLAYAKAEGFAIKNVANAAGYAECGEGEKLIGLLCHLDVVPTGSREQWKHDPFTAVIEDGKLYGRGTIDDKGPALASLFAMKAIRDSGLKLKKRYRLIVGLDEESGFSRCLGKYLAVEETPAYSFSPDAYFPVINAEKGIIRFDLVRNGEQSKGDIVLDKMSAGDRYNVVPDLAEAEFSGDLAKVKALLAPLADADSSVREEGGKVIFAVKGVVAHAMEPDRGKNALQKLLKKLVSVKEFAAIPEISTAQKLVDDRTDGVQLGIASEDAASGKLTCNAAAMKLENGSYSMRFDVRYPVTANSEKLIQSIRDAAATQGAELIIPQHKKPLHLPAEMPFIQMLVGAYNDITGEQGKPFSIGGGSYCRFLDNAVSFGPVFPSENEMAHHPNEFVALDSLRKMTHIYAEALYRINEDSSI